MAGTCPVQHLAGADTPAIMDVLRLETRELHTIAEQQPLQRDLAKGRLSREKYIEWLGQMRLIHGALDDALRSHGDHPIIRAIVTPQHFHSSAIDEDRAFLGGTGVEQKSPQVSTTGVNRSMSIAASVAPIALLGFLYVLEGSMNGGKFLARAVRRAYSLPERDGTRYLDPYGDAQQSQWQSFKDAMNAAPFTAEDRAFILDGARTMFRAVADLSAQLGGEAQAALPGRSPAG